MSKIRSIEELSTEEQIDIIIGQFSGHERMEEVASIFSTLTSYKITDDDYLKYYDELVDEEIEERINNAILNNNSEDVWQEEQNAWSSIINALGITTIFEVMDNWKKYVGRSIRIGNLLSDTKKHLYTEFLLED
ncbi:MULTISPECIES: hypothetical protein [Clostridium]|uniref:Uncharacterized protein n=1 Tax=Clostridium carnis TaxID=1530 RepID=A0ABY6STN5_9CLOT|nr:hypothetical protein [Clostridium carnis]CAI3662421.1 conserved hypothetical protein [Clostridium neonatale]CAI3662920.1 conserved hypothetical protein [Clostridium neonatale]CAI3683246.1 conserved hypothetical protein [Clostridium neonatale]CAI3694653.1 conserved hypothetical protein [Clostridium neonatale]CAI3707104.1 conserved hypothetical protein [Clostridium neonatale]